MNPEISRKLIHLFAIIIPVVSYHLSKKDTLIILGIVALGFVTVDALRLRVNPLKTVFIIIFGSMLRKRELKSFTGGTYLMIASFLSALLFSKYIFLSAVSFLIVGDTFSAIIGQAFGRIKIGRKTLEGGLAGFVSCLLVVWCIHKLAYPDFPIIIGVIGAVVASAVEIMPVDINDNVVIPLSSGFFMEMVRLLLF